MKVTEYPAIGTLLIFTFIFDRLGGQSVGSSRMAMSRLDSSRCQCHSLTASASDSE